MSIEILADCACRLCELRERDVALTARILRRVERALSRREALTETVTVPDAIRQARLISLGGRSVLPVASVATRVFGAQSRRGQRSWAARRVVAWAIEHGLVVEKIKNQTVVVCNETYREIFGTPRRVSVRSFVSNVETSGLPARHVDVNSSDDDVERRKRRVRDAVRWAVARASWRPGSILVVEILREIRLVGFLSSRGLTRARLAMMLRDVGLTVTRVGVRRDDKYVKLLAEEPSEPLDDFLPSPEAEAEELRRRAASAARRSKRAATRDTLQ